MAGGIIFVISAPSGAGKSTLIRALMNRTEGLFFSVSHTTRQPRPGETTGVHYHFVDRAAFEKIKEEGGFLEWAEVHGNYYGTSFASVEQEFSAGHDVILDIDVQGAAAVKAKKPDAVLIFILPPSMEELERRLTRRGEEEAVMRRRLANARKELDLADRYDYLIVNDEMERAADELHAVVSAERLRTGRRRNVLEKLRIGL
jgi:guanylate kinase